MIGHNFQESSFNSCIIRVFYETIYIAVSICISHKQLFMKFN